MPKKPTGFKRWSVRTKGEGTILLGRNYSREIEALVRNSSFISESCIKVVLDGNVKALMSSFRWSASPQGSRHWSNLHDGRTKLTDTDVEFLTELRNYLLEKGIPDDRTFEARMYRQDLIHLQEEERVDF